MIKELDLLEAESIGFEAMDLVKALPGVLQQTGQAISTQKKPDTKPGAKPETKPESAPSGIGLGWKIGGGVAVALLLLRLLRRPHV